jgi:hypothetical protein
MKSEFPGLPISQYLSMDTASPLYYSMLVACGMSMLPSVIRIFRVYLRHKGSFHPREACQLLFIRFRPAFLILSTLQFSLGLGAGFAKLIFFAIVLSSMLCQVRKANGTLSLLSLTSLVRVGCWKLAPMTACFQPSCPSRGACDVYRHVPWRYCPRKPTRNSWLSLLFVVLTPLAGIFCSSSG